MSPKRPWTKIVTVVLILLVVSVVMFEFLVPWMKRNQRINQLKEAGLTDEQAAGFDSTYSRYAQDSMWVLTFLSSIYNQTVLYFAGCYGNNQSLAREIFNDYDNFGQADNFLSIAIPFCSINSTFFNIIRNSFLHDPQITIDRNDLTLDALKLYQNLSLIDKNLFLPTIQGLDNITIANKQLGLPLIDNVALWLFANSTQQPEGKYLVNFSPIVFKSVNFSDVSLTPNPARETWSTAKLLSMINESGFDIENHHEMFLGFNGKVITNNWCIFDNPYGINYIDKNLSPNDSRVLDLQMLQWNLYSQFAPQRNGSDLLYNRDFPWYNSTELITLYPDRNELRAALFNLFYLRSVAFSIREWISFCEYVNRLMEEGNITREQGGKMFEDAQYIEHRFIKNGIEGARISLTDAYDEYQKIENWYPNETIGIYFYFYNEIFYNEDPREDYYGWLSDRQGWGLDNTVQQYIGIKLGEYNIWPEFTELVQERDGLDQFLTKNWNYWDLVKFIVGYERWNQYKGDELDGIQFIMPEVLRMIGFPTDLINIEPTPEGASPVEWAVGLPPYIVEGMENNFPNENILYGPGYTFGLHSCEDGLIKDNQTEAYVMMGDKSVYLLKRD